MSLLLKFGSSWKRTGPVGCMVGLPVGFFDGLDVGLEVEGAIVGIDVGIQLEGTFVGINVGLKVEGAIVGLKLEGFGVNPDGGAETATAGGVVGVVAAVAVGGRTGFSVSLGQNIPNMSHRRSRRNNASVRPMLINNSKQRKR